ncbi:MAG: AraC family transcriptional regulator [Bacteroidota bacterium]
MFVSAWLEAELIDQSDTLEMNLSLLLNYLVIYGALQALFISAVILTKKPITLFKKAFVLFLTIEGITLIERFLVEAHLIESVPHLLGISYPISFVKPPLLLFMAVALTQSTFKLRAKHLLHFTPFLLMLLINIPFYLMDGNEKVEMVMAFMQRVPGYGDFEFYFNLSMFAYIGIYIVLAISKLNAFTQHIKNNDLVNWYLTILKLYSGLLVLHLLYFIFRPLGQYQWEYFNQVSMLMMTFIIQSIVYKLVGKSAILENKAREIGDREKRAEQEAIIVAKLEVDKLFLDDSLSLKTFSEAVSLSPSLVSEIINQKFNCSFKNLLAQYRLKEAKMIMSQRIGSQIKLVDVAYDAGFNNKVTFYRVFKQFEGVSPSEYLQKLRATQKIA